MTYYFGTSLLHYQTSAGEVRIKFGSTTDSTFRGGKDLLVGNGQLLGALQDINYGILFYSNQSSNSIVARMVDSRYYDFTSEFAVFDDGFDAVNNFGVIYSDNLGFIAWGVSSGSQLKVMKQAPNFYETLQFESVHVNISTDGNANTSHALLAAMDPTDTAIFIFRNESSLYSGYFRTGKRDLLLAVMYRDVIPSKDFSRTKVLAMASNRQFSFMLLTSITRKGQEVLYTQSTENLGASWSAPLEVLTFTPGSSAIKLVTMTFTDRWVVVLNTNEGFRLLQLTTVYPFAYEWTAAFKQSALLNFKDSAERREISIFAASARLYVAGTNVTNNVQRLGSELCLLRLESGAGSLTYSLWSAMVAVSCACLVLFSS